MIKVSSRAAARITGVVSVVVMLFPPRRRYRQKPIGAMRTWPSVVPAAWISTESTLSKTCSSASRRIRWKMSTSTTGIIP